jgi:hypothetical protein
MLRGRLSWARTTPPIREWSGDAPVRIYKRLALATRLASAPDDGVEERRPRLGRSIRKPLIRLTSAQLFEALGPEDHAAMPGPAHPHRAMTSRGTSRRLQVSASDGAEAVTSSVASCITASATASRARKLPGWMLAQPTIAGTRFRGSAVRIQAGRWSSRLVRKSAASGLRLATLPLKRPRPFPRRIARKARKCQLEVVATPSWAVANSSGGASPTGAYRKLGRSSRKDTDGCAPWPAGRPPTDQSRRT